LGWNDIKRKQKEIKAIAIDCQQEIMPDVAGS